MYHTEQSRAYLVKIVCPLLYWNQRKYSVNLKMINRTRTSHSFNYGIQIILSIFFRYVICAVIAILFSVGSGSTEEIIDTKFSTNLTSSEEKNVSAEILIKEEPENKLFELLTSEEEKESFPSLSGKYRNRNIEVTLI